MGRLVGIDYGIRRIGVSICDRSGMIASPATTLDASGTASEDADRILRFAVENGAQGVVLGLPLNMDESDSEQTKLVRALADELRKRSALPVELWDERLSSFQADEFMNAASVRRSRRKKLRDALAAQVILQGFLDARRYNRGDPDPAPETPG